MRITAITLQKKNKNRSNIFIDDAFTFSLDLELVVTHKLKQGMELTQSQIDTYIKEGDFAKALNDALKMINIRPRSKREITDYLRRKEVSEPVLEMVIDKLSQKNVLNDTEFAHWFVEQRTTFRPKGKYALTQELKSKGVEDKVINEVLRDLGQNEEVELAQKTLSRKLKYWQNYSEFERRKKIQEYLLTRGFNWGVIETILTQLET